MQRRCAPFRDGSQCSQPGGKVAISWSAERDGDASRFVFTWQESGGSPVTPPSKQGFGSVLITRVLKGDFGGEVGYDQTGLVCRLTTSMEKLAPELPGARD